MKELGIVDIREIIKMINQIYDYDFSKLALTSFKLRLEKFIPRNNLQNTEQLIRKISDNKDFFEIFLHEIFIPSTEMFRDPSLWRWLREEYFSQLSDRNPINFKIWLPTCVSGAELYSILILLKELNLLNKVKIIASCYSNISINNIKKGELDVKKIDISNENYRRFQGASDFENYYRISNNNVIIEQSLLKYVEFEKQDLTFDNVPMNANLILFRNSLIYFNSSSVEEILSKIHNSLSATGLLIVGIQERINGLNSNKQFELYNDSESIYKKRI